jgi:sensor histidine kinase YesM
MPAPRRPPPPGALALPGRGLLVGAFCAGLAALQVFIEPARRYPVELAYSLSIGTSCWLLTESLRLVLRRPGDPGGWPRGWRGAALLLLSIGGGFLLGTALADAWFGRSSWGGWGPVSRRSLAVTVVAGVALSYFFHSRGRRAHLEAAAREAARTAAEARLKLLETQLEPHMLFNTLANLRVLVTADPPRAEAMLDHLIAFLRSTLGGSRAAWHPLADEFDRLRDYLALMQMRMGPRLACGFDLPDALAQVPVPPLLLQPLVENSIRHGLEPQVAGGRIDVVARAEGAGRGARLVLEVRDTGVGLPPGGPDAGRDRLGGATTGTGDGGGRSAGRGDAGGFGTAQVRERLAAAYGPAATIEFVAGRAGGTCAIVAFPLKIPASVGRVDPPRP